MTEPPVLDADPHLVHDFRTAMSRLASAVTVVTAGVGGEVRGLTATAVASVSLAPPTLLVCVNRLGESSRAIARAGHFCVNILAEGSRATAERFAGRGGGDDRFAGVAWSTLTSGAPALDEALVAVDCRVAEIVGASTHNVVFGEVVEVRLGPPRPPLVHFDRDYRSLA